MVHFRGNRSAFGAPGREPHWANSTKDGVGTAYSTGGRVWFTIWRGILMAVLCPTVIALNCAIWSFFSPTETDCLRIPGDASRLRRNHGRLHAALRSFTRGT